MERYLKRLREAFRRKPRVHVTIAGHGGRVVYKEKRKSWKFWR